MKTITSVTMKTFKSFTMKTSMFQKISGIAVITIFVLACQKQAVTPKEMVQTNATKTVATNKKIAVIGSSSAYGTGASPIDSSWVNRLREYFGDGGVDTIYNLAVPGTTTYAGMPTGYVRPANRNPYRVNTTHNITKALSYNPDIVILAYPSNDIGHNFLMRKEYLSNLRAIYHEVIAAGKVCYVASTQPCTHFTTLQKDTLVIAKDSIMKEYGAHAIDFYDPIVGPGRNINPIYDYGDGTHPNDAGHRMLFTAAKTRVVPLNSQY
jgi:lysophospholipase L1-like esterase